MLSLRAEVLEETERRVPAGVVIAHLARVELEALGADERDVFHEETLGELEARVRRFLRDRIADPLGFDGQRVAAADSR